MAANAGSGPLSLTCLRRTGSRFNVGEPLPFSKCDEARRTTVVTLEGVDESNFVYIVDLIAEVTTVAVETTKIVDGLAESG